VNEQFSDNLSVTQYGHGFSVASKVLLKFHQKIQQICILYSQNLVPILISHYTEEAVTTDKG
jgi:hypothetical protein